MTHTRSPATGAAVESDSTLMSRSAPRVVTNVRSADGSTSTRQVAVSLVVIAGADTVTSSAASEAADQVAVGTGPVGSGVHAGGTEAGGGDQDVDRAPGVPRAGAGHHVLAAARQRRHLHDHVDERLAGVDHATHPRTSAVVARVICGG